MSHLSEFVQREQESNDEGLFSCLREKIDLLTYFDILSVEAVFSLCTNNKKKLRATIVDLFSC